MGGWAKARIQLCGRFVVDIDGVRIEDRLPGRRGRVPAGSEGGPRSSCCCPGDLRRRRGGPGGRPPGRVGHLRRPLGPGRGPAGIAYHVATRPFLTGLAPYRETGHRLLLEALERRGNLAEALRAYQRLRVLLREELGVAPSPAVQAVHRRLLLGGDG